MVFPVEVVGNLVQDLDLLLVEGLGLVEKEEDCLAEGFEHFGVFMIFRFGNYIY